MAGMRIGDAAAAVGVAAHVLRHWESVGLLDPPRSASGHRTYDRQSLDQARLVRTLRRVGLSLDRIRELGLAERDARLAIVSAERAALRRSIELLESTDRFLAHVAGCRHPIISDCPECSRFAAEDRATARNGTAAEDRATEDRATVVGC